MHTETMIQQFKNHHQQQRNGDLVIKLGTTQIDVFPPGKGWTVPTRYRKAGGLWVYQQGPKRGATYQL